jgi:hypothetical protein
MERAVGARASRQRPVEDIEVILGKFSAWSTSQPLEKRPRESVAEISYEQALRAVGYRAPLASPPANEKLPESAAEVQPKLCEPKRPSTSKGKKTRTGIKKKRSNANKAEIPNARKALRHAGYEAKQDVRDLQQEDRPMVVKSFPELIKQQVGVMEEFSAHKSKSVSLTVRLAPGESALVKARAAEAQVSVSAYMRQCALDVDKLRGQVETALVELRSAHAASSVARTAHGKADRPELSASGELQRQRSGLIARGFRALRSLWGGQSFARVA